jgi:hypothetical protein
VVTISISALAPTFNVSFTGNPPLDDDRARALQGPPAVHCAEAVHMTQLATVSRPENSSATRPAGDL